MAVVHLTTSFIEKELKCPAGLNTFEFVNNSRQVSTCL